jgi:hypothetical protein
MTKTHAMGSGISDGMRYLLRMIFNLAIDQDDEAMRPGSGRGRRFRLLRGRLMHTHQLMRRAAHRHGR